MHNAYIFHPNHILRVLWLTYDDTETTYSGALKKYSYQVSLIWNHIVGYWCLFSFSIKPLGIGNGCVFIEKSNVVKDDGGKRLDFIRNILERSPSKAEKIPCSVPSFPLPQYFFRYDYFILHAPKRNNSAKMEENPAFPVSRCTIVAFWDDKVKHFLQRDAFYKSQSETLIHQLLWSCVAKN